MFLQKMQNTKSQEAIEHSGTLGHCGRTEMTKITRVRAIGYTIVCAALLALALRHVHMNHVRTELGKFGRSAEFGVYGQLVEIGSILDGADDADLAKLNGCTSLESLELTYSGVSDSGVMSLTRLPALTKLRLKGTAVTDVGINKIIHLPNLRHLALPYGATDASLRYVGEMACIESLELDGPQITEEGLAYLVGTKIRALTLGNGPVSVAGLAEIGKMPCLEKLSVGPGVDVSLVQGYLGSGVIIEQSARPEFEPEPPSSRGPLEISELDGEWSIVAMYYNGHWDRSSDLGRVAIERGVKTLYNSEGILERRSRFEVNSITKQIHKDKWHGIYILHDDDLTIAWSRDDALLPRDFSPQASGQVEELRRRK